MREASAWWVCCCCWPKIKIDTFSLKQCFVQMMKPKLEIISNQQHAYVPAVTLTYVTCPLLVIFWGQDIEHLYAPASDWLTLWMWRNRSVLLDVELERRISIRSEWMRGVNSILPNSCKTHPPVQPASPQCCTSQPNWRLPPSATNFVARLARTDWHSSHTEMRMKQTSWVFCYTKHFWTLYKLSNGALEVTWNRVRDAREQEHFKEY